MQSFSAHFSNTYPDFIILGNIFIYSFNKARSMEEVIFSSAAFFVTLIFNWLKGIVETRPKENWGYIKNFSIWAYVELNYYQLYQQAQKLWKCGQGFDVSFTWFFTQALAALLINQLTSGLVSYWHCSLACSSCIAESISSRVLGRVSNAWKNANKSVN